MFFLDGSNELTIEVGELLVSYLSLSILVNRVTYLLRHSEMILQRWKKEVPPVGWGRFLGNATEAHTKSKTWVYTTSHVQNMHIFI